MNFWKQTTHVMAYFNTENFRGAERLPDSFMKGFLEVSSRLRARVPPCPSRKRAFSDNGATGSELDAEMTAGNMGIAFFFQIVNVHKKTTTKDSGMVE